MKLSVPLSIIMIVFLFACQNNQGKKENESKKDSISTTEKTFQAPLEIKTEKNIDIRTYKNETQGWGYDIYKNGRLFIHQPHIPAVSGNEGFHSEQDAEKTAAYVCYKMEQTQSLPSLSINELDSHGVLSE